jgi:hypothetical protein
MWKTFFYWISFSNEFLRFILWFLCQLIQSFAMKRFLHDRIRDEKTSWKWRLSFTTVNVFFHARNLAFFMRNMLILALLIVKSIISIDLKSKSNTLWNFFLKFIENDRFSWMKNAVNNDWWMRKWIVNKTKMKRWIILDLKDYFFFVFV